MGERERNLELNRRLAQLSNQLFGQYNCSNDSAHRVPYVDLSSAYEGGKNCDSICPTSLTKKSGGRQNSKASSIPMRCLICYVEVGKQIYNFRKQPQFINTLDKFLDIIVANDGAKFATKNGKVPKLWVRRNDIPSICCNCFTVTKLLVSTFEQLNERISELRTKIKCAIKLSTRIATENEILQNNFFMLDHIRKFIVEGPSGLLSVITEAKEKETGVAVKLNPVQQRVLQQEATPAPISQTDDIFNPPEQQSDESRKEVHHSEGQSTEFVTEYFSDNDNVSNAGDNYDDLDPEFIPEVLEDCGSMSSDDKECSNKGHEDFNVQIFNAAEVAECSVQFTGRSSSQDNLLEELLQVTHNKIATASDADNEQTFTNGSANSEIANEPNQKLEANRKCRIRKKAYWQKLRALYPPNLSRDQVRALHSASLPARRVEQEALRQEMKPAKHALMLARRRAKRRETPKPAVAKAGPKKPLSQTPSAIRSRNLKLRYPGKTNKEIKKLEYERKSKELKVNADGTPSRASVGEFKMTFKNLYKWVDDSTVLFRDIKIRKLDNGTFECSLCNPSFNYKQLSSVAGHIQRRHIDLTNSYECEHCERKYYYHNQLVNHLRSRHRIGDRLQCHLCGMTFGGHSARHYHIKAVHEKNKPNKCEHCGKAFLTKKDLTIHVRRHTGERPFVCHVCAATFVEKQSMKKHIRTQHPDAEEDENVAS
ncbi:unnamed protein product [Orchesella dallaii]|uniref:C2H2-type domain-containing protein n=1 Tax=Orchesella dallaii TaxID=48710 RepID=A0ABP1R1A0_9HEXA